MTSNCINNDVFGSLIGSAMKVLRNQRRRGPFKEKKNWFFWVENHFLKVEDDLKCGLGPYLALLSLINIKQN